MMEDAGSQGYECTQQVEEPTAEDEDVDDDPELSGSDDVDEACWGRLINDFGVHELEAKASEGGKSEQDVYTVGRHGKCDIVVDEKRVSGQHCRVYREWEARAGVAKRLVVYVEDTSSNGTFLNQEKLAKRSRRALKQGDELSLLLPKLGEKKTAYVFVDVVAQRFSSQQRRHAARPGGVGRSLTVAARAKDRSLNEDYDVRDELGAGAMGKVYRATERKTGEHYAVKVMAIKSFAMNADFEFEELLNEARMLRNLAHDNIVSVKDVYSTESAFSIVMQLVDGGDLLDRIIQRGPYSEADARGVLRHLLDAVGYLHARGIVHRDIKPENILLRRKDDDVDVLLTDFGIAKGSGVGSLGCTTFCGTPQYLAPEVMAKHDEADGETSPYDGAAADVWSVGVVLYVLLAGTQPRNSRAEFKNQTCSFDGAVWRNISDEAKDVVRRMTQVEAKARPTAAEALQMRWFSPTLSSSMPPPPPKRRRPND
ncbi:kinase-like domain-containing protein [Pelagophyceae sp. CCMP2097]|nr:kinase-like domain-containing protein [Pelagophyceae sp. CCMP2097]|mmetsp:Transcript_28184/g.94929  ORF Transcript_28184/g.94929 Transcript_28184/m.94929 type:complete len:483 (+) Transcript_28184:63-1511(+)